MGQVLLVSSLYLLLLLPGIFLPLDLTLLFLYFWKLLPEHVIAREYLTSYLALFLFLHFVTA